VQARAPDISMLVRLLRERRGERQYFSLVGTRAACAARGKEFLRRGCESTSVEP